MKLYRKIAVTLLIVLASSCTLDLREDPNAVQPTQVLPSLTLNTMQRNLADLFQAASSTGMAMTRLQNAGSSIYQTSVTPEGLNGIWSTAYAAILQDAHGLIQLADEQGYARHAGIARIIQAYTIVLLVDYFGDVPFSEAFQGAANFNPAVDNSATLYAEALAMLDRAKQDLTTPATTASPAGYLNPVSPAITDQYYNNNYTKWVRLANTLKLKIHLNLRLTSPTESQTAIAALIADASPTGGLITAQNENFIWRYGTTTSDPDGRHPRFVANYPAGGGNYMSNYLMWQMFHGYDATQNGAPGDPRIRFYFYRQVNANSTNSNDIRCLTESTPSHYPSSTGAAIIDNLIGGRPPLGDGPTHATNDPTDPAWGRTFCYPTNVGYWGRDHVDPQGIPPDNTLRTAWGAYPSGGRFDNNSASPVSATVGMRGAGFQPIMMRSYVSFMLAEAALFMAVSGIPARNYYEAGITQSFTDVRDWAVNGTYSTNAAGAAPNEAATINAYYPLNFVGTFTTAVRAATTANLPSLSGNLTIDNVALADGDRVLVKNQTTSSQNGIYVVSGGSWTRAAGSDEGTELLNQAVLVTQGTLNSDTRWLQTATGTITVGTTAIVWVGNFSYNNDVTRYLAQALLSFDNKLALSANEAMNYVGREYWIASFGNGVEAYNLYRRTGKPTGMQPVINPQPGDFPRSFWYPANFANLNNTVEQKANLSSPVFWDNNTTNLNF